MRVVHGMIRLFVQSAFSGDHFRPRVLVAMEFLGFFRERLIRLTHESGISVKFPFPHSALFGFMATMLHCLRSATMPERRHDLLERLAHANRLTERAGEVCRQANEWTRSRKSEWTAVDRRCIFQCGILVAVGSFDARSESHGGHRGRGGGAPRPLPLGHTGH